LRAALLAVLATACAEREAPGYAAPVEARAALVLEPSQVAVGDVADLVLAVVTHPGTRVEPVAAPASLPGFWLVEREALAVDEEPARWVHRTRLRIRAVEVGRFELPGGVVRAESADGAALEIAYAPLPIEVVSSLGEQPEQRVPYGVRRLPVSRVGGTGVAVAFAAGAGVALGGVGVVLLARRRRAERAARPVREEAPAPPPWETARERLAAAEALCVRDPRAALDASARALRRYVAARFGADAPARTWEELAAASPPFLMTTRWGGFVSLLAALDAARFRPTSGTADAAASAAALLGRARAFVEDTAPREPGA
jgi:hypothetical protein